MHLHSVLRGAHSYLTPTAALAGLPSDVATRLPPNSEHSIAEIVAHMAFWQDWFLDRCDGIAAAAPAHADLGWPSVGSMSWEAILERFERGFSRALALSDDEARTNQLIAPAIEFKPLSQYTTGDALIHVAIHNAHHTGQVITLRQQMRTWPPPSGSWTW